MLPRSLASLAVVSFAVVATAAPSGRTHAWRVVEDRWWQIESDDVEDPAITDMSELTGGACPEGMVEIAGAMRRDGPAGSVEELEDLACADWVNRTFPARCARFDEARWRATAAALPAQPMRFCVDRFEYPNRRGAYPFVLVTWYEARDLCAREGKRLCTEDEWTFACEGEDALPYPYGYDRDRTACVIDRAQPADFKLPRLSPRASEATGDELDHLWRGEPSGSQPRCISPFRVFDMTGNVDEWTVSVHPGERPSILKGGYWGPVRTRCRPSTRAHGEGFAYYQQGFRCCADVP